MSVYVRRMKNWTDRLERVMINVQEPFWKRNLCAFLIGCLDAVVVLGWTWLIVQGFCSTWRLFTTKK